MRKKIEKKYGCFCANCRATNNTEVAFVTINICYYSSDYILSVQIFILYLLISMFMYYVCIVPCVLNKY